MKKFKFLSIAFVAIVLSLSFYACGSDDDDNGGGNSELVGTWMRQNYGKSYTKTLTFNANGTGMEIYSDSYYTETAEFTWKTTGNKLIVTWKDYDSYSYSGSGEETEVYIYAIAGDILTLTEEDDYYSGDDGKVYKRVK